MLHNPFLNRSMICSVDEFFGRQRELNYVMGRIGAPTPQSVSVLGERRTGKSSFLWHIAQKQVHSRYFDEPERYVFLLVDFQGRPNLSEEEFCRFFGEQLRAGVPAAVDIPPLRNTADILTAVQNLTGAGLRLVCLFDEFESITRNAGFSAGFFGFLRSLANLYPVAYVTSSRRDLPSLCHEEQIAESPFFNIFSKLHLGSMPEAEVEDLIATPSVAAGLSLLPHTEALMRLGGRWPFFVQIACATAFDLVMETGTDEVDMSQVEYRFQAETDSHFHYFWDHFNDTERAVLASLANQQEPDATLAHVTETLARDGYVQNDESGARLFSISFEHYLRQVLAKDGRSTRAGPSTASVASTADDESLRRSGSWSKRLKYTGAGLFVVSMLALLSHVFSAGEKPNDADAQLATSSRLSETNYPTAAGFFRLFELDVNDIFASFYPTYTRQPLGRVRITNDDSVPAEATLQFYLSNWQRRPTEKRFVLAPQTTQDVDLMALLDPAIVHLQDVSPVQAKVVVTISSRGQVQAIQQTQEVRVYGRGALRWDSVSRAAAFITSTDRTVDGFARSLLVAFEEEARALGTPGRNLIRAMVLFEALKQHEVRYVPDANTPYARSSVDKTTIDHVQYPAEVLKRKAGDCDDLTALYCALLENVGIATALVDYPGHIFPMFDTGISRNDADLLPLDKNLYVVFDERLWIPLEITQLDKSFLHAWRAGVDELSKLSSLNQRRLVVPTDQAWQEYPPASLSLANEVAPPDRATLAPHVQAAFAELRQLIDEYVETAYLDPLVVTPDNKQLRLKLIKLYLALLQYDTAINTAETHLLQKLGDPAATYNQLGVGYFMKGELTRSALNFQRALDLRPQDSGLRGNLDLVLARMGGQSDQEPGRVAPTGQAADKGAAEVVDVDDFYWLDP
ncbi:MAG: hypothetical protein HOM68_06990 [Gemmatimonadetes bacterium]|jgi:hypothetical protein|nr:hypothetical protein [Gemmatimonadota bacterium]MBT5056267.1 hypothetical protein [Gemmatimonadota bacterium]MBT5144720.1 hypothetical protein [Gemmatimonadota bacterium]MBT5589579.1 hypothetical protein [Gemmatimonadota bacterium]MBT5963331.1 hypothetical protein [Gemmatimonadota bacterium]